MKLVSEKALLLIIDLQKKLVPSIFNKEEWRPWEVQRKYLDFLKR